MTRMTNGITVSMISVNPALILNIAQDDERDHEQIADDRYHSRAEQFVQNVDSVVTRVTSRPTGLRSKY